MKNINLDQLVKPRRTHESDQRFINSKHYSEIYTVSLFDGAITVLNSVQPQGRKESPLSITSGLLSCGKTNS